MPGGRPVGPSRSVRLRGLPLVAMVQAAGHRSLVHGKLLAEGEVLEGELTMAAEEEREEPKQVEQEGNHRAGSVAGSRPEDQLLTGRPPAGWPESWVQ